MAKGKELEKVKGALPAGALDYGEDAGKGMEGIGPKDLLIPFLRILQSNSPEVSEADGKYIRGARPGMILNTATKEVYPAFGDAPGIVFVVAKRDLENYMQWHSRDAGGGLAEVWDDPNDERIKRLRSVQKEQRVRRGFGKIKVDPDDEKSDDLIQTLYLHGVARPEGENPFPAVISFSSTQIKKHRQLTTNLNTWLGMPAQAPVFCIRWRVKVVAEKNTSGSWFGWHIAPDGETWRDALLDPGRDGGNPDPLYATARLIQKSLAEGTARADYSTMERETEAEEAGGDARREEDEIPMH